MINLIQASTGTPLLQDASFWVLVCVLLFFALLFWKGAHKALGKALDDRADGIRNELEEAKRLREEAQSLLASIQRKQKEAEEQAEDIVKQARRDSEVMAAQARQALAERLERRAAMAEAKIQTAVAQAEADIRSRTAELAVQAAQTLLQDNLKAADHTRLVKDGIAQMGKTFN